MFKYSHLVEIGLYDKNFLAREEEDLIFRFKKNIKLPEYLSLYIDIENILKI